MTDFFINPRIIENRESLVQMKNAHMHFPMPVSPGSIQQWIRIGAGGVRLGSITVGRSRYTSEEEIRRFLLAQQNPGVPEHIEPPTSSSRTSPPTMTSVEVDAELRRFGFCE